VASNISSKLVETVPFLKLHYPLSHTDASSARQQDFFIDLKFGILSLHLHFYFLFLERAYLGYIGICMQVLNGHAYNRKCDVYSFGICLWEIYCCDMPYPDLSFSEVTSAVVRQVKIKTCLCLFRRSSLPCLSLEA
jgi:hypothetical protein